MIDQVHFENYKSLRDVSLELGRLTVLVGPNGCGKSSVLQAIHALSQTGIRRMGEDSHPWHRFGTTFGGRRDPRRTIASGEYRAVLGMHEAGGDELTLEINTNQPVPDPDDPRAVSFTVRLDGPEGRLSASTYGGPESTGPALYNPRFQNFVSVVYLHLDAQRMAEPSSAQDEVPRMAADGANLASVLAWMKGAQEEQLARVIADLAQVVPGVRRIRTLRERVTSRKLEKLDIDGQPLWRPVDESSLADRFAIEFDDGRTVPADLLSEGTVLALGLLTKLRELHRPRLILLDDIDRGLHIEAQSRLVDVLRALLSADPDLQIVCTTHSPYLLDRFRPEEVRVLALDGQRNTHAQALTAHPDFADWRFGAQTGELWAALGDGWVAAERAP